VLLFGAVMKRTALALTLTLLLLAVVLASANSLQASASSFPLEPVTDPPVIIVYSPSNTTYYENSILVNFTIIQPDSWHQDNLTLVSIDTVSYQLDNPTYVKFMKSINNQFSEMLKEVSNGKHSLQIDVETDSIYKSPRENWFFTETYTMNTRLIINFTVDLGSSPSESPSPSLSPSLSPSPLPNRSEPFPTLLAVVVTVTVVAVVAVGLLVYFKKRRREAAQA
jgi:hypothetical protein